DRVAICDQIVDVKDASCRIKQHGSNQKECRCQHRGHEKFECRRECCRRIAQSEKAIGGNRDNLQEDKEIEEIAGHHHALDAHDEQQEEQQYSVSFARDVRGTKKCDQIDAECEDTFVE